MTIVPEGPKSFFQQFGSMVNFVVGLVSLVTIVTGGSILWANTTRDIQANTDRVAKVEARQDEIDRELKQLGSLSFRVASNENSVKLTGDRLDRIGDGLNSRLARIEESLTRLTTQMEPIVRRQQGGEHRP